MAIYAISDLHGRMDLYQEVCKFLKPEDKVICLGDCGDRGPDGWALIKAVYENPQWDYLMGNHEHILLHAMMQYLDGTRSNSYTDAIKICHYNGGGPVLQDWITEGADRVWIDRLSALPRKFDYVNIEGEQILCSHAGYSPDTTPSPYDLLWDREHSVFWWPEGYDKTIIVHGHTPTPYIMHDINGMDDFKGRPHTFTEFVPGALWYCQNHKIDIDCGAFFTNHTVLLDLDTFDEHIFGNPSYNE